jgi:hypothetical protein
MFFGESPEYVGFITSNEPNYDRAASFPFSLPLVEPIGGNQATALVLHRRAKRRLLGDVFRTGVDQRLANLQVFGPRWGQSTAQLDELALAVS